MAFEKRLPAVPPTLFTLDGNSVGRVSVANTSMFKVKQVVAVAATGQPNLDLEVKQIDDVTTLFVGPVKGNIKTRQDIYAYTVVAGAYILAQEQNRPNVPEQEVEKIVYDEEPTCAFRNVLVDRFGNRFDSVVGNDGKLRLAVDANVSVHGISVDLDAFSNLPDNVLMVGSEDGTKIGVKHAVKVGADLNLRVRDDDANTVLSNIKVKTDNLDVLLSTRATEATLSTVNSKLSTLGQKDMNSSMPVVLASNQSSISVDVDAFSITPDNVMTVGSRDGTKAGTKYGLVYNVKAQILAAHDRQQSITYADFGTKDQRITQIDYTSATFTGTTARKTMAYTLVGNKYRRDSINWIVF